MLINKTPIPDVLTNKKPPIWRFFGSETIYMLGVVVYVQHGPA